MSVLGPSPPLHEPSWAAWPGLLHGFTLRSHGSAADAADPDSDPLVEILAGDASDWTPRLATQVHGSTVALIGAERPPAAPAPRADALVTAEFGELLVVRTADCLPVLLVAEQLGQPVAVAAVHAGWRGLVAGILDSALDALEGLAPTARVHAALGPAIGPCCFEIGPEVAQPIVAAAGASMVRPGAGDRQFADLPAAAARLLEMRDVVVDGEGAPPCTRCRPDLFHSHRAEGGSAGRMAAFIGLRS